MVIYSTIRKIRSVHQYIFTKQGNRQTRKNCVVTLTMVEISLINQSRVLVPTAKILQQRDNKSKAPRRQNNGASAIRDNLASVTMVCIHFRYDHEWRTPDGLENSAQRSGIKTD